jgi:hypothetical protein
VCRAGPERADRAETFAEPEGRAVAAVPAAPDPDALDRAGAAGLDRGGAERKLEAAEAEGWLSRVAGAVAGLNVATDSMAPATRQTARMLASSGMIVPCPANGAVSLRIRRRRRRARSSRW